MVVRNWRRGMSIGKWFKGMAKGASEQKEIFLVRISKFNARRWWLLWKNGGFRGGEKVFIIQ